MCSNWILNLELSFMVTELWKGLLVYSIYHNHYCLCKFIHLFSMNTKLISLPLMQKKPFYWRMLTFSTRLNNMVFVCWLHQHLLINFQRKLYSYYLEHNLKYTVKIKHIQVTDYQRNNVYNLQTSEINWTSINSNSDNPALSIRNIYKDQPGTELR